MSVLGKSTSFLLSNWKILSWFKWDPIMNWRTKVLDMRVLGIIDNDYLNLFSLIKQSKLL